MSDPDGTRQPPRRRLLLVGVLIGSALAACRSTTPAPTAPTGTPVAWPERIDLPQPTRGTLAAAINRGLRQNRVAAVSATPADHSIRLTLETIASDPGWLEVSWPADTPPASPADFRFSSEIGVFDDAPDLGDRLVESIERRLRDLWDDGYAPLDRESPNAPPPGVPLR